MNPITVLAKTLAIIVLGIALAHGADDIPLDTDAYGPDAPRIREIIGGSEIIGADYPFYATVNGCGGSIVRPGWIVTAQHCLGDHYANSVESRPLWYGTARITFLACPDDGMIHAEFIEAHETIDLALVRYNPASACDDVGTVDLPRVEYWRSYVGSTEFEVCGNGPSAGYIAGSPGVGTARCKRIPLTAYEADYEPEHGYTLTSVIRTGGGDSGGPLLWIVEGRPYLLGVGARSDRHGTLATYAKADKQWIARTVARHSARPFQSDINSLQKALTDISANTVVVDRLMELNRGLIVAVEALTDRIDALESAPDSQGWQPTQACSDVPDYLQWKLTSGGLTYTFSVKSYWQWLGICK